MAWTHDFSPWIVGPVITGTFVGSSLVGLLISRRWSHSRGLHALVDNGVIGWIFSAILGIYAISIGLIAVATWTNTSSASNVVTLEAAQVAALYRDFDGYPEPTRRELERGLLEYLRTVIEVDWPAQRRGEIPHTSVGSLLAVERILYAFSPPDVRSRLLHAEALRAFNRLIELRRQRLDAVDSEIPLRLWAVVLIGAGVSIASSYVFSMESASVHALMTGLLAGMISLLVFFIAVSDPPFRGRSGISPVSYELVLRDLQHRHGESAVGEDTGGDDRVSSR